MPFLKFAALFACLCGSVLVAWQSQADPVLGDWHILLPADDEVQIPEHRMDVRFKLQSGELVGAVLNRRDGSEIPLHTTFFDGTTLRFQMRSTSPVPQADMPFMVMKMVRGRFEGAWTKG